VRVKTLTRGLIDTPLLHTASGVERDTIVQNRAAVLPGARGRGHAGHAHADDP
jgi:hypothetical protein